MLASLALHELVSHERTSFRSLGFIATLWILRNYRDTRKMWSQSSCQLLILCVGIKIARINYTEKLFASMCAGAAAILRACRATKARKMIKSRDIQGVSRNRGKLSPLNDLRYKGILFDKFKPCDVSSTVGGPVLHILRSSVFFKQNYTVFHTSIDVQSLCILYKKYQYVDHTNFIYFTDILEVINRNILLLHDTFNFCKILCSIVFEHFFLKCYVDRSHRRKFSISSHFDYSKKFSNMWLNDDHRAGQRVKAFWSKIDWFKRYFDFNSAKLCI